MPGGTQNRPGPPSPTKRRMFFWLVQVLDALMSILILAPLVVAYWRGTFNLLEIYLLPQYPLISIGVSFEIALVGGVLFIYIQDVLRDYIHNVRSPISELMLKRVYCYVFGLVVVNHWRGVWALWDKYTGFEFWNGVYCFSAGMIVLLSLRCFRNSISPPMVAASDLHDEFFTIQTRFRVSRSKPFLFFLDCLFSVAIPGSAIVCVCRGFWYMLDGWLVIDGVINMAQSCLISSGLGIVLVAIALLLQKPAALVSVYLEDGNRWFLKICFEDLFMALAAAAGFNIWRGVWGLCNEYVFPDNLELSSWTCHVVGIGGLMLMFHGSSALLKGFQLDGEFTKGEGCYLPSSSFTIFKRHMGQTHRVPGVPAGLATTNVDTPTNDHTILTFKMEENGTVHRVEEDSDIRQDGADILTPWEEKVHREIRSKK